MLAIVPVVLYHAGLPILPGGFIGVDVFFVISGFLITRILQAEITQERFSLLGFYERRVRRILPALMVVVFVSLLAGFVILPPIDFVELSKSAIAASLFVSNFWFWITTSDYFGSESEFQFLLHTWSLAVEEQFYICFPLVLWFLSRWHKRGALWGVAGLTAVSLTLAVIGVVWAPSASFYLLPTRGWELGLGALLALGATPPVTARWLREAGAAAGLSAILAAAVFYDAVMPYPGLAALLPCLGAALLIWSGSQAESESQGGTLVSHALSLKPVVSIGLISYSLYLWHWPILAVLRHCIGVVSLPTSLAAAGVSAALAAAALSWRYIEQPFRRRSPEGFGRATVFRITGIGTTLAIVLALGISIGGGLPERVIPGGIVALAAGGDKNPDLKRCFNVWPSSGLCRFGRESDPEQPADFLLWGDSHALALMSGVAAAAREAGKSGLFAGQVTCPPLLGAAPVDLGPFNRCGKFNAAVLAELEKREDARLVILAARWPAVAEGYLAPPEPGKPFVFAWMDRPDDRPPSPERNFEIFKQAISETVAAIRSTGRRVIILGSAPEIGWNVPRRLGRHMILGLPLPRPPTIEAVSRRQGRANAVFTELADLPEVTFFSLTDLLCDPLCRVSHEGRPLYYDDDHLSHYGSTKVIGSLFLEKVWRDRSSGVY